MKEKENNILLNIHNLTALWQAASMPYASFMSNADYSYCVIDNSDWPNRLWFNKEMNVETITDIKENVFSKYPSLILPHWNIYNNTTSFLLEENGFKKVFEQAGMSLILNQQLEGQNEVDMQLVSSEVEATQWCKLFKHCFGYWIKPGILLKTLKHIRYYIASYQDHAVGTALTNQTNSITGVHAVGVLPEARRKGFAEKIMQYLINKAIDDGSDCITLQASDKGKGLYLKLGFEDQFLIKNYALQ